MKKVNFSQIKKMGMTFYLLVIADTGHAQALTSMPELAPVTRQIFSFIFQFSIFHIALVNYHCGSRSGRAMVYDKRYMENGK